MRIYSIVNPSDPYTLKADLFEYAAIACLLLGNGAYGLQDEDGQTAVPIMIFGGHEEWFKAKFGSGLNELFDLIDWNKLADCLDTVLYGNFKDREMVEKTVPLLPESARDQWLTEWHDRHGSANDIGKSAKGWSERIRAKSHELNRGAG